MPTGTLDQPEPPWWAAGVQPRNHPSGAGVFQLDVIGADQFHGGHVDQSVSQYVGAQQHLTVATFKTAQVNFVLGQHDSVRMVLANGFAADEHLPAADFGDDPGHQRILIVAAQPHDDVLDPADGLAGGGQHGRTQEL